MSTQPPAVDGSQNQPLPCGCQLLLAVAVLAAIWFIFKPFSVGVNGQGEVVSAKAIFEEFEKNEISAGDKWIDKSVRVRGRIEEIKDSDGYSQVWLYLDGKWLRDGVACAFWPDQRSTLSALRVGDKITVAGTIVGRSEGGAVLLSATGISE